MFTPNLQEFTQKSREGNLIPVYKEIMADMETPLSAFLKLERGRYAFLLESVEGGEKIGRYSFLGSNPEKVFKARGARVTIEEHGSQRVIEGVSDPLGELARMMAAYTPVATRGLPRFCGGAVGYMAYDAVRYFEHLPEKNQDDLGLPDLFFILTDTILIFDHVRHTIKIVSNAHVAGDPRAAYEEAIKKIERIEACIKNPLPPRALELTPAAEEVPFRSNVTRAEFESMVERAKEYIRAGDVIQVVLSQRLEAEVHAPPFNIYRALRSVNPSPYMYYLQFGDTFLVGSSPEIHIRCEDDMVEVRPIAGTRPRGIDEAEDRRLEQELLADPKERAEHIMLVDLGRNDIGRVCVYGSVVPKELMVVERYSHVMHIVSDIQGRLRPGANAFDALRASFPAGTVSGAPKIRAMEIIDELENRRRGPYAGAVGYFSFTGNLDSCITIRTILIKGNTAYVQAGAGIVADSVPEREYEETLNKARAMLRAIAMAEKLH
ncbi:MAG: anthranilate synthase component I [Candidatus Aureabacteria bacterium]|nr:anthranilate synthase component I [Candidatus Auribacterota bacterium]